MSAIYVIDIVIGDNDDDSNDNNNNDNFDGVHVRAGYVRKSGVMRRRYEKIDVSFIRRRLMSKNRHPTLCSLKVQTNQKR